MLISIYGSAHVLRLASATPPRISSIPASIEPVIRSCSTTAPATAATAGWAYAKSVSFPGGMTRSA